MGIFNIWGKIEEENLPSSSLGNDTPDWRVAGKVWGDKMKEMQSEGT